MIPNKDAIIDFDTLLAATHKWVIDEYHQKEHWEIHDSPADDGRRRSKSSHRFRLPLKMS